MSAVFSGNTPGAGGMCTDFDLNATELNSALENTEILTNGVLTLTKIDGSTTTNNIPYFADFVISGLKLTISNVPVNRTLTYTSGTYQINAQVYSIPVGANFQLTAGHPTLPRIDILYLTNTNNIFYQTGTPAATPVQPTAPAGTLLLAAIGVQINATVASNYTLVTVNTNAATIAPPALTPGTVTGSHLYWDGLTWSENTFWNVGNSAFVPGARIHTYTDTDSSGILTTAKLGDSAGERGFNWIVNHTLNGFITQMDITTDGGETFFTLDSSDSNLFAISSIWNSAARNTFKSSSNTTDRSTEILQQDSSIVSTVSTEVLDPLNNNTFTQNITSTTNIIQQGLFSNTFQQDVSNKRNTLEATDGNDDVRLIQDLVNGLQSSIAIGDYSSNIQQDAVNFFNISFVENTTTNISSTLLQDITNQANTLRLQGSTTASEFKQSLSPLENTLSINNATSSSQLTQSTDNFLFVTSDATGVDTEFNAGNVPVAGENGFQFRVNDTSGNNDLYCLMTAQDSINNKTTFKVNQLDSTSSDFSAIELSTKVNQINLLDGATGNFYETIQTNTNGVVNRAVSTAADSFVKVTPAQINLDSYNVAIPTTYTSLIQTSTGFQLYSNNSNTNLISNIVTSNGTINLNGGLIQRQVNTAIARAVVENDYMIVSTAALTVTLPAAPADGRTLVFRSVTGTMTINGNGKNIEAAPTTTVTVGNSRTLIFNATLNRWLNI